MRSSWVWMMVLVALGSAQKPPKQMPGINHEKLKGIWYPLATAHLDGPPRPSFEYRIYPKDKKSFEMMIPIGKSGACEWKTATATAAKGGYRIDTKKTAEYMYFVDTDYTNYHIVYNSYGGHFTLYLYGRKKVLTDDMKTIFAIKVDKLGINPKTINYNPKIECSF